MNPLSQAMMMGAAGSSLGSVVAFASAGGPYVHAYPWSPSTGFGTKYSNPASSIGAEGRGVFFDRSRRYLGVAGGSNGIYVYRWINGFSTRYTPSSSLPTGTVDEVCFSPASTVVACTDVNSPYVHAYSWSSSGFGAKYASPTAGKLPTGNGHGIAFSPDGAFLAVAHSTSPYITIYSWSDATGFVDKIANPVTLPTGNGRSVAFSPDGTAVAVGCTSSPYVFVYAWSSSGFGAKFSNPSTLPTSDAEAVCFSNASNALAVGSKSGSLIYVYPWSSSGFGTKFSDPSTLPPNNINGVTFDSTDQALIIAHDPTVGLTNYVSAYAWSTAGFGTKFSDPVTNLSGAPNGVSVKGP